MSKYDALWQYLSCCTASTVTLSFDEIVQIARVPLDHSFLNYKKELLQYGFQVEKISLRDQMVKFVRLKDK